MPFTVFSRYIPQTASLFIFTSFLAFDRNFCGSVKQLRRRVLKQRQQRPQPGVSRHVSFVGGELAAACFIRIMLEKRRS